LSDSTRFGADHHQKFSLGPPGGLRADPDNQHAGIVYKPGITELCRADFFRAAQDAGPSAKPLDVIDPFLQKFRKFLLDSEEEII
jgi:hypothetical protein